MIVNVRSHKIFGNNDPMNQTDKRKNEPPIEEKKSIKIFGSSFLMVFFLVSYIFTCDAVGKAWNSIHSERHPRK